MSSRAKSVRVIKRKQRERLSGQVLVKSENELRREMVQQVASWIEERRVNHLNALEKAVLGFSPAMCDIEGAP